MPGNYVRRDFAGGAAASALAAGINASVETITITVATGWASGTSGPFAVVINEGNATEEKVLVQSRTSTTLTVVSGGRAYDGTTASTHDAGETIQMCITAQDLDEANNAASEMLGKITTKGDLWVADGDKSGNRLAVGADARILMADAAQTLGVKWVAPSGDVTIGLTGAMTIGAGAVDKAMLNQTDVTAAAQTVLDDATVGDMRTTLGVGAADSPTFASPTVTSLNTTTIEVGHATDTTVARSGAGDLTVEGNLIYRAGGTDVPVTDGGTGASTVGGARTALGIHICADQPARLALSPATGDFALEQDYGHTLIYNGSSWVYTCCRPADITWAARTTALTGEILAYGQTVTTADVTYPGLWAVVDTAFKSGTSLVVPDLRGNVIAGLDNMGGSDRGKLDLANTMGTEGGAQTHALSVAELATHSHSYNTGDSDFSVGGGGGNVRITGANTTGSAGSGSAHNNMQPTILLNGFIRL